MWSSLKKFFSSLFSQPKAPAGPPVAAKPAPTPSQAPAPAPVPAPAPAAPSKPSAPSREDIVAAYIALATGKLENTLKFPWQNIRETAGKNRSTQIDALIRRQGGKLAEPYCQYGQQEALDDICAHFKVPRKQVKIPEGGSTQAVFEGTDKKYIRSKPLPGCWMTWRKRGTYKGHVGHITAILPSTTKKPLTVFEFNTDASSSDSVVRDGQGAGFCKRSEGSYGDMDVRGYIDVAQAVIDAWHAVNED